MRTTLFFILLVKLVLINSHGWLDEPVARSSAWLYNKKFDSIFPNNYMHTQMNCGGYDVSVKNDLKCGICGEDFNKVPKDFEKGGDMYIGQIVQTYSQGQNINVTVQITANHLGYSEFLICNVDNLTTDATQECLNKIILKDSNNQSKFYIKNNYRGPISTILVLPPDLKCNHCVFQWRWNTGNRWGTDPVTSESCLGCGPQEQFYGCSDIRILGEGDTTSKPTADIKKPNRVSLFSQCGGKFYTGYTTCVYGATCYFMSEWYSQCLTSCPSDWECNANSSSNTSITSTSSSSNTATSNDKTTITTLITTNSKNDSSLSTQDTFTIHIESNTVPIYGQCGGSEYFGPTSCLNGSICYIKSKWYSQCLLNCPSDWECNINKNITFNTSFSTSRISNHSITSNNAVITTTTHISNTISILNATISTSTKTASNISLSTITNNGIHIESNTVPIYGQCGGIKYFGPTLCLNDSICYIKSKWYSQCLLNCPTDWECNAKKSSTKLSPTTIKSNTVSVYSQCGGIDYKGNTLCANGTKCYTKSKWFSQCLPICPSGWECTDTTIVYLNTNTTAGFFNTLTNITIKTLLSLFRTNTSIESNL